MRTLVFAVLLASSLAALAPPATAQSRSLLVEGPAGESLDLVDLVRADNPDAPFVVNVALPNGAGIAREGETVQFEVRSAQSGYLTLVNRNPNGTVTLLYPNRFAAAQRIEAGQPVLFPAAGSFRIRVAPPFGQEMIKAIVTPEPLISQEQAEQFWEASPLVSLDGPPEGSAGTDLGGSFPAEAWATGVFFLTTAPAGAAPPSERPSTEPAPDPPTAVVPMPPLPESHYSSNPGRSFRTALKALRRMTPGTRSLGDEEDEESQPAWEPAPEGGLVPFDSTLLVLYRPAVGTRSFGTSLSGGGVFSRVRQVEPDPDTRDASGLRSLSDTYGASTEEVLDGLRDDPDVLTAVPNYQIRAFEPVRTSTLLLAEPPASNPDEPPTFWPFQWGLHNAFWRSPEARVDMDWRGALEAYRPSQTPIVVAVLDTGIHPDNPHLAPVLWSNDREVPNNGIDDDGNGFVDDTWGWDSADNDNDPTDPNTTNSHGTFVAAQIAGRGGRLFGMAPDVEIMPVRVLGAARGSGYDALLNGIRYAAQNGARVINMSLGAGPSEEAIPSLERLIGAVYEEAEQLGVLLVVSAGNESSDSRTTYTYPAAVSRDNSLVVAALNIQGQLSSFSNYGPAVDVAAPGQAILGHQDATLSVKSKDGTSMAAPYVAALAAMLFAQHPDWTPAQVKARILETARPLDLDVATGAVVDAAAALGGGR